jgi:hypothetical protein
VFAYGCIVWETVVRRRVYTGYPGVEGTTWWKCECPTNRFGRLGEGCVLGQHCPAAVQETPDIWLVPQRVTEGRRPEFPACDEMHCPPELCELARRCWAEVPSQRPAFWQIFEYVQQCDGEQFESAAAAAAGPAPTVQQWLESLGLESKQELLASYIQGGAETIVDVGFREFLEDEDLDEYVDEMVGEDEDELTEDEATKLRAALQALVGTPLSEAGGGSGADLASCEVEQALLQLLVPTLELELEPEHGHGHGQGVQSMDRSLTKGFLRFTANEEDFESEPEPESRVH